MSTLNPLRGYRSQLRAILQHSATPTPLFEHEDEHSLSAVATALWCTPLKIGLASEARSTTGARAKAEARGRFCCAW